MGLTAAQLHQQTPAAEYWARAERLDPSYFASRPEERAIYDQTVAALRPQR
jgi:hypothetical protein